VTTIILLYLLLGLIDATVTLLRWQYYIKEEYDKYIEKTESVIIVPFNIWLIENVLYYVFLWPIDIYYRLKRTTLP